jgi:EAL domain-containing protein (putative c-di-GMP-specific phosphodiesterase class I)/CheY-like chemotaxis protein
VDDDPHANATICRLLSTIGVSPQGFTDPAPFLLQARSDPPDVIVLDLALGRTDAVDVIRQLESISFEGDVLLTTGHDELTIEEITRTGLFHGLSMLPALRKPFRAADLQQAFATQPARIGQRRPARLDKLAPPDLRLALREAMQKDWLELWYQPKIDLKSLLICGAEALLRARHPEFGIVCPAQLLPPTGDPLYHDLSNHVIRRALSDWQRFADAGLSMKLAVNVPFAVVQTPDFVRTVRQSLPNDSRFPGLIVEVTESDLVHDPQCSCDAVMTLERERVSVSIDDFGHAGCSLAQMPALPYAELKLDRHLVSGCANDKVKRVTCEAVADLAHRSGLSVCAEGVERIDDLRRLTALGFDTAQGFFFAKPMPPEVFIARATGEPGNAVTASPASA